VRRPLAGLSRKKLRGALVLFFIALTLPTGVLVYQAYSRLKWEAFHQHQLMAEELSDRIRSQAAKMISAEEARSFTDYAFLVVTGSPTTNYVQRSPLSNFPVSSELPGILGYFQVDADGRFSTPLLPSLDAVTASFGVTTNEWDQRHQLARKIQSILSRNRLVQTPNDNMQDTDTTYEYDQNSEPTSKPVQTPNDTMQDRDMAYNYDQNSESASKPVQTPPKEIASITPSPSSRSEPKDSTEKEAETVGQAAFDQLNTPATAAHKKQKTLGRVEDLKLERRFTSKEAPMSIEKSPQPKIEDRSKRRMRTELSVLQESPVSVPPSDSAETTTSLQDNLRIRTFESEIDPYEFSHLESGHFVLFRKVWRDGQHYIQGLLIEQQTFLKGLLENNFRATGLSHMSDLIVAFQGDVLAVISAQDNRGSLASTSELKGALLYQTRLNTPLGDLELIFSINRLPAGPGGILITWISVVLILVLCSGFLLLYRLGRKQITLARQQQDFVSAVSHELKTPLTSIRMYGEMLREGWASEEKKREYYEFIHGESERLSRLINNVLQLARMTRNDLRVNLKPIIVNELMDTLRSKITSQVERTGFHLNIHTTADAEAVTLEVDPDYFTQIFINLVDNAIKFSSKAPQRTIEISCVKQEDESIVFSVRDYGPGIPKDQMRKIFKLFYRSENELTRETLGTGIGLALVNQLSVAMHGKVDVVNLEPGAEFRISFTPKHQ
jgi:signal transduction histidine kinase